MKTPIKRKAKYNMNQCSNKPKKKNLDNDTRKKFCEAAKKRIRTIRENLDDEATEKLRKID